MIDINPDRLQPLDQWVRVFLQATRIPGAALTVLHGRELLLAKGYGSSDLAGAEPITASTTYPIASTTKAMNATLLGMLASEGRLSWDVPVREYLPRLRLRDPFASERVTLRDLITMRTGLGRHDWVWIDQPISRVQLVERLATLEFSAAFRERFQYNNLGVAVAGHVAEVVTGESWEALIQERLLRPLGMTATSLGPSREHPSTRSYQENSRRELVPSTRFMTEAMSPAGGLIHSNVTDMARWVSFNLLGGAVGEDLPVQIVDEQTLNELHTPQMASRGDPAAPSAGAAYALGWWVDRYNGHHRVSHTGYVHGVQSSVMFFPALRLGFVAFVNFGAAALSRFISQAAFDLLLGLSDAESYQDKLASYESALRHNLQRFDQLHGVRDASPSHTTDAYAGAYVHPGYGDILIEENFGQLCLTRNGRTFPLRHWHYDVWSFERNATFEIHQPHPFDPASRVLFETDAGGAIRAFSLSFDSALMPIRFDRHS
jgi:CubicO group peptidase (beta-lactamase class C family)